MTKEKNPTTNKVKEVKTKTRKMHPVMKVQPILTPQEIELQESNKALELMAINNAVEMVQNDFSVNIGVQLNVEKIGKIMSYMIENSLKTVNLKFEIWK